MEWKVDSSMSSDVNRYYQVVYDTGVGADTNWRMPMNVVADVRWHISPPEAGDLLVEGDISAPKFEKRLFEQMENMITDRLQQLLPLYIDAIRWGRPEESFTGSRCVICGAPVKDADECAYCGR